VSDTDLALKASYAKLTREAKCGLYVLLVDRLVPPDTLRLFLTNPTVAQTPGGAEEILKLIFDLYRLGVENFEHAFIPSHRDDKLLSVENKKIAAACSELRFARWLACMTDATTVRLERNFRFTWELLSEFSPQARAFFASEVEANLETEFRYRHRSLNEIWADISVERQEGLRIVEMKRYYHGTVDPRPEEQAYILLQVFKYALVIKQQKLLGLELVFEAASIEKKFVQKLLTALHLTGIPFVLRTINGIDSTRLGGNLSYPILTTPSSRPTRSLPPIPDPFQAAAKLMAGPTESDIELRFTDTRGIEIVRRDAQTEVPKSSPAIPASASQEAPSDDRESLPWTPAMRTFLGDILPTSINMRSLNNVSEFIFTLRKNIRYPEMVRIVRRAKAHPRVSDNHSDAVKALVKTIESIPQSNAFATTYLRLFVQLAATVCRETNHPKSDAGPAAPGNELARQLSQSAAALIPSLKRHASQAIVDLSAAAALLAEDRCDLAFLSGVLDEWNFDAPFLGDTWSIRDILDALRTSPEILSADPRWEDVNRELKNAIEYHEGLCRLLNEKPAEEDAAKISAIFASMPLYVGLGALIFDPHDLEEKREMLLNYLLSLGAEQRTAEEKLPKLIERELSRLTYGAEARSLPDGFQRADRILAFKDPHTGWDLNATQVAEHLWKAGPRAVIDCIIRLELETGTPVYFLNINKLSPKLASADFYRKLPFQAPSLDEINRTFRKGPSDTLKLLRALWMNQGGSPNDLDVASQWTVRVSPLKLHSGKMESAQDLTNGVSIELNNMGALKVIQAVGDDGLQVALSLVEGITGSPLFEPIEQAFVKGLLGDHSMAIWSEDLKSYLSYRGNDPVQRLLEIQAAVDPALSPDQGLLMLSALYKRVLGIDSSHNAIVNLRIKTDKSEPQSASHETVQITFERSDGNLRIRSLNNAHALTMGIDWFMGRAGREIGTPLETALLAGIWQCAGIGVTLGDFQMAARSPEKLRDLWALLRKAAPGAPKDPKTLTLFGTHTYAAGPNGFGFVTEVGLNAT